jgi:hypothetical protein
MVRLAGMLLVVEIKTSLALVEVLVRQLEISVHKDQMEVLVLAV